MAGDCKAEGSRTLPRLSWRLSYPFLRQPCVFDFHSVFACCHRVYRTQIAINGSGKSSTSKKALCASTSSSSSSSSPLCEGNDSQSNHYLLSHKPDSASFRISCLSSGQWFPKIGKPSTNKCNMFLCFIINNARLRDISTTVTYVVWRFALSFSKPHYGPTPAQYLCWTQSLCQW